MWLITIGNLLRWLAMLSYKAHNLIFNVIFYDIWYYVKNLVNMPISSTILVWRFDGCVSASGSVPCIVVSTAAVTKEIFQNNDAVFSSWQNLLSYVVKYDRKTMGTAPYRHYWRQARRVANQELFNPRRRASYIMRGPDQRKFATWWRISWTKTSREMLSTLKAGPLAWLPTSWPGCSWSKGT